MSDHKNRINETIEHLEAAVRSAPAENQEEIRIFLEGYLTALEQEIRKRGRGLNNGQANV